MTAIQILLHKEWKKIEADLSSDFSVMVYSKDVDYKSYNVKTNAYKKEDSYISKTAYKETQQYKNGRTNIT